MKKVLNKIGSDDFSGLNKEQLIELLTQQQKQLLNAEVEKKRLADENVKLKTENADLLEKLAVRNAIIKKMGIERMLDTSDNANNHSDAKKSSSRFTVKDKIKGGNPGRKVGSKNMDGTDFEALSKENEVIMNDILEQYLKEHPGSKLVSFGEPDVSYVIEHIKATFKVHKVVTPKYRTSDGKIVQAPAVSVINHCYMSAGSLAYFIAAKYSLGIPVYRMKYLLEEQNIRFSRGTIYHWLSKSAQLLEPVWEAMKNKLSDGTFSLLNIDETRLRVMEECSKAREQCYMYLYSGDNEDKHLRFFDYTGSRESTNVKVYLEGFSGTVVVDGYKGYDSLESDNISLQRCQVHARRKFTDITKVMNEKERQDSEANKVVELLDVLFEKEASFKEKKLSKEEIVKERSSDEYRKAVNAIKEKIEWLDKQELDEQLRKAVNYYKNGGERFWTYLNDGASEMHNNAAERVAKSFATLRKSFLFCRTRKSSKECATLMTLVKSAEACEIYPDMYIEWCLNELKEGKKGEELLPWSEACQSFRIEK